MAELEKVGEELANTAMINVTSTGPEQLRGSVKSLGIMVRNLDLEGRCYIRRMPILL